MRTIGDEVSVCEEEAADHIGPIVHMAFNLKWKPLDWRVSGS